MKIKGVEIAVSSVGCRAAGVALDAALRQGPGLYANERNVRAFIKTALRASMKRRLKGLAFFVSVRSCSVFPAVALAKILAQEIYRHIKEDKTTLKKIRVCAEDKGLADLFNRTITGYLTHLVEVLSQGPLMTVDTVIEVKGGIVLIKRSNPPFGWALPGGFVDYGESLEHAAAREAREETGLRVKVLRQMRTYSEPGRDPRFQTVTTVFVCRASGRPRAASDAAEAGVFALREWKRLHLAFDHKNVLADYLKFRQTRRS